MPDHARAVASSVSDPFHGTVQPGSMDYGESWHYGIHKAVGGYHDAANPGDMLCAALAACLDSTISIIANRLGVQIDSLEVDVSADVGVRGTLLVDRTVPVGFQQMRCRVDIQTGEGVDPKLVKKLLQASEHCCVNLQTLRSGVHVETTLNAV